MFSTQKSLFIIASLVSLTVLAAPIHDKSKSRVEPTTSVEWAFVDDYATRNQVLDFYENVVEEVFTAHTEEILEHLVRTSQPNSPFTVNYLTTEESHASCVHKIENSVANNVQAMSQHVYSSIEKHVDENLILLDAFNRNSETAVDPETSFEDIAALVFSLNQVVSDQLAAVIDRYSLMKNIENDLPYCDLHSFFREPSMATTAEAGSAGSAAVLLQQSIDSIFGLTNSPIHSKGLWLQSAKTSVDLSVTPCVENPIDYHIQAIRSDVLYEIENRSMDIVNILYDSQFEDLDV
ncbi:hypothetical protein J3Q64DRAFT_1762205 [Phycomyces blakesleeanus]|uniref:Uncharacterized protein n=2 Tax=Phycomyces blakesleeanus TaxID=4837 RepID=A0A167RCA8_PHYB8|nr:hypothetical protein PHYBLDRAFT_69833 [Phycomyces blakesleeanus NRRL 1555(-)]OAD81334.1 hypothetical protein PHYBLDRAFT_69833 [Phycomyces blakesleeanus NRRL 1555(-)]|eukprot:XP_018299374.1 hypothetical protein PHYBLDRAFT_69833 [Phycomyces blakesleeanus NRRL 1555(-)]